MASSIGTFKAFAVVLAVALFSAAVSSAQEFNSSPSPAPAPQVGAAGAVSSSVAIIGASVILSLLAILKN